MLSSLIKLISYTEIKITVLHYNPGHKEQKLQGFYALTDIRVIVAGKLLLFYVRECNYGSIILNSSFCTNKNYN